MGLVYEALDPFIQRPWPADAERKRARSQRTRGCGMKYRETDFSWR